MAAGGPSSFCLVKRNQNRRQQKCFGARAFALQNGQNLGWIYFAPARSALTRAKTSYALPPHHPSSFWTFSPEAPSADTLRMTRCFFCNEICS
jgi:hypothetical protein